MRRNELYFNLVEKIFENGQKKEFHEIAEEAITQLGEENYDEKKIKKSHISHEKQGGTSKNERRKVL